MFLSACFSAANNICLDQGGFEEEDQTKGGVEGGRQFGQSCQE